MNKSTQVISFRLGDEELNALQSQQQPKESLNQAAQRLLKTALGFDASSTSPDTTSTNLDGLKTEMLAYLESSITDRFAKIQNDFLESENPALAVLEAKIEHLSKVLVVNIPTKGKLDELKEIIDHTLLTISTLAERLTTLEARLDTSEPLLETVLQSSPEPPDEVPMTTPDTSDEADITTVSSRILRRTVSRELIEEPISTSNSFDEAQITKVREQIIEELKVGTQSPKYKAVAKALDIFTKELCSENLSSDSDVERVRSTVLKSLTTGRKSGKLTANSSEYKAVTKALDDFISMMRGTSS
jgi:hypothetical protein